MPSVIHLTASQFVGGPERQMLGLAEHLRPDTRTVFVSFSEEGNSQQFLVEARRRGFDAIALTHDTPYLRASTGELASVLRRVSADVLCCHGYKAGIVGRFAARRVQVPVVAVSRGWTSESVKVRAYELIDRINLRWMDRVVCVSNRQAAKVRGIGVPRRKVVVIPNAIDTGRFGSLDPRFRTALEAMFPKPIRLIVGAAGRLSPEKGFSDLVDAAALVIRSNPEVGFLLFGEGKLRPALIEQIAARGLRDQFILAGFRSDLDRLLPHLDLLVQSSYTEGMPNVILEACAAGVPVVATWVGGTPEILEGNLGGYLVPPGDPRLLGETIHKTLEDTTICDTLVQAGLKHVREHFSFEVQAAQYRELFSTLVDILSKKMPMRLVNPTPAARSGS